LPALNESNSTARWTQVEAIVKAAGLGISHAMDIEWNADESNFVKLSGRFWWWQPVQLDEHHVVHVAAGIPLPQIIPIRVAEL